MRLDLSIIIPCKDSAKDLVICLSSIASQLIWPASVIIVDDSSDTNILDVIIPLFPLLPITYLRGEGKGLPYALNMGFNQSKTHYLAWINSDDYYYSPFSLAHVQPYLVGSHRFIFGNSLYVSAEKPYGQHLRAWQCYTQPYTGFQNIFTGSLFFSNDLWLSFGGFPPQLSLAFEYALINSLFSATRAHYLNKTIAVFNNHGNNLSSIHAEKLAHQKASLNLPSFNRPISYFDRAISYLLH